MSEGSGTKIERGADGRVLSVTGSGSLEFLIFATMDDLLIRMKEATDAQETASNRLERLTWVLVFLTLALVALTVVLVSRPSG